MNGKSLSLMVGLIFYFIVGQFASAATTTITDPVAPNTWGDSSHTSTGGDPNAAVAVADVVPTSGGNPGSYFDTTRTGTSSSFSLQVLHSNVSTYQPSVQGAITNLDFSIDSILFSTTQPAGANAQEHIGVSITQNNIEYIAPTSFFVDQPTWTTTSFTGLSSTDFSKVLTTTTTDSSLHPNFSSTGAQIKFGTYLSVFLPSPDFPAGSYSIHSGFDNLSITVTSVPEPSSIVLASLALGALLWQSRPRRRLTLAP